MVNYEGHRLDRVFHALSDQTRRRLLMRLAKGPANVTELASPFNMSLAAVSKHLKVLEGAGFIQRTRKGRVHRCAIDFTPLEEATAVIHYLRQFWHERLHALDHMLQDKKNRKD